VWIDVEGCVGRSVAASSAQIAHWLSAREAYFPLLTASFSSSSERRDLGRIGSSRSVDTTLRADRLSLRVLTMGRKNKRNS